MKFSAMYYKYVDESKEDINSLNSNQDFLKMINGIIKDGKMKLHVFVDHEEEERAEPVPIEVGAPMLLLSQTPSEVEIQYSEEDLPQPSIDEPRSDEPIELAAMQPPQQATRTSADSTANFLATSKAVSWVASAAARIAAS